jgi:hypothetical protein
MTPVASTTFSSFFSASTWKTVSRDGVRVKRVWSEGAFFPELKLLKCLTGATHINILLNLFHLSWDILTLSLTHCRYGIGFHDALTCASVQ